MRILADFIQNINDLSIPELWANSSDQIDAENKYLRKMIDKGTISIYGVNTLPGHRDNEKLSAEDFARYQDDLLESHAIDVGGPYYSKDTARHITYSKLYSLSAGMSGLSLELFHAISQLAVDPDFSPSIPKGCSYSSGDVIPAAHWARAVLNVLNSQDKQLGRPGEAMALINGNFVQVGYAASIIRKLKTSWLLFLELSAISSTASQANATNFYVVSPANRKLSRSAIDYIVAKSNTTHKDIQDPVSLRGIPQVVELLSLTIEEYLEEVDCLLRTPSGNPLYAQSQRYPLSQASFLAPTLTLKAGALLEAILFSMWSVVGRTNFLLSGNVDGIPQDASSASSSLGLIQYPKLMMSILEKSRLDFGRRSFASGSSTSYGTEDLWSNGLVMLDQLDRVLDEFLLVGICELYIFSYIEKSLNLNLTEKHTIISLANETTSLRSMVPLVNDFIHSGGLKEPKNLFPV